MQLKNKTILLTGGRGFVGGAVFAQLKVVGVSESDIRVYDRAMGDLREEGACREAVKGIHTIVHLAGVTGGIHFHRENAESIYEDNLTMGLNLLSAAHAAGVEKFLMAGSLMEYGMSAPIPFREETLWDGEPRPAHAAYARAKREILKEATRRRHEGLQSAHLLLASMYGPGEKDDFVIPKFIKKIMTAKKENVPQITERGTGASTRDFLFVKDAAEAIVMAADSYDADEPLNIASGKETSIKELATTIGRLVGYEGKIVFDGSSEKSERIVANITCAKEWGWSPQVDLREGLRSTIKWHIAQQI